MKSDWIEDFESHLGLRYHTFRLALRFLEERGRPCHIVETGCARVVGNFSGDGLSTLIFAKFIAEVSGGSVETIDISSKNIEACKTITQAYREILTYTVSDSVAALRRMSDERVSGVDLFYLDSMDLDPKDPEPSMRHHQKELDAIYERISPEALILLDDNLGKIAKGKYVKDFLLGRGWELVNDEVDYQWLFRSKRSRSARS